MSGELPLSRSYAGLSPSRIAAARGVRRPALARRTFAGLSVFVLLLVLCLPDLNTVAYNVFGAMQVFSYVILAVCVALLLVYRFTIFRDLGPSGHLYLLFLFAYIAIGTPIGLRGDPDGLLGRWNEIRLQLASLLIVAAAAVAARGVLLAYGVRFTLGLLTVIVLVIPLTIWLFTYLPDYYRVRIGEARDFARASGTFNNPNEAGTTTCLAAAVFFAFMVVEKSKVLSAAGILLAWFAVYLTASRGAFVILFFLTVAQLVVSPGFKKIIVAFVGGVAIASVLVTVYKIATVDTTSERSMVRRMDSLWRVAGGEITDETTGGRWELAKNGLREWATSPLLGNGLGSQRRVGAANIGPHNAYIRIGGEAGVIALFLYVSMLASLAWRGWKCSVPAIRTFAVGLAIVEAIACLTSHDILTNRAHNVMLGVGFGLLAGCLELNAAMAARRGAAPRVPSQPPRRIATNPA